jgi:hypothetical protein
MYEYRTVSREVCGTLRQQLPFRRGETFSNYLPIHIHVHHVARFAMPMQKPQH